VGWKGLICICSWCHYLESVCCCLVGVRSQNRLGHDRRVWHGCGQSG